MGADARLQRELHRFKTSRRRLEPRTSRFLLPVDKLCLPLPAWALPPIYAQLQGKFATSTLRQCPACIRTLAHEPFITITNGAHSYYGVWDDVRGWVNMDEVDAFSTRNRTLSMATGAVAKDEFTPKLRHEHNAMCNPEQLAY